MKAKISMRERRAIVTLIPENDEDKGTALGLAQSFEGRPMMINFRGFSYLNAELEFYIQPMPRGD